MKKLLLASSLALGLASGLFADTLTLNALVGGAPTGSTLVNFDGFTPGNSTQSDGPLTVSFGSSGNVVNGSVSGVYAAPYVSGVNGVGFGPGGTNQANGQDATNYLTSGTSSITFQFATDMKYFGLLWGSVDDYNTLSFYNGALLVGSFTGIDVVASAHGDQGALGTFYVNINNLDGVFNRVVATSTTNAFEIDNVSYDSRSHVPDSGATLLLIGLGLAGLISFRRKL